MTLNLNEQLNWFPADCRLTKEFQNNYFKDFNNPTLDKAKDKSEKAFKSFNSIPTSYILHSR